MLFRKLSALTTISLLLSGAVQAEEAPVTATDPSLVPVLMSSETMVTEARVEAIDYDTRVVTLRAEGGEPVSITASEEAHNLDQIEVGDTITAKYMQSVRVEIAELEEGAEPSAAAVAAGGRAEKGETPAAGALETIVTVSIVEEINLEKNTFKLKGPDGEVREYTAENPENLKLAKVGDGVVITVTEAVALSLSAKAGAEAAGQK